MLKQFIVGAAAIAAGVIPFSGVASADSGLPFASDSDGAETGLVNVGNVDLLHNVDGTVGLCDNNVNVLGVQVPVEDVANGVGVPVASPGASDAEGAVPENCASSTTSDGGTVQDD
ncbi:hypothetical protein [Actinophytocola algeriensis]|uniref:Small secreted domain DUF320 n=1 Tax=Actinophytocola algeriensis TaxID=1768010 RepID=A0A7W7Q2M6_9PSEU|nr:hypothetical protein [Actinophytocola algeriensis]MBB4905882.1 hypothetical protein [Actinophytocola algeriensis]MBE1472433.1 hypothetical protein [Actinophytocola algeriensis]